jgi:hypothetical protein
VLGVSEFAVNPFGTIVYEYPVANDVLTFIGQQLEMHSPVGSGRDAHAGQYKASHVVFADGVQVPLTAALPPAHEYIFVSTLPYARKIEDGESAQAPSGVYELTANEARKRYGNVARVEFIDYTGVFGVMVQTSRATYSRHTTRHMNKSPNRFPAISVTMNGL